MTELGPSTAEIVAMWIVYGVFVVAMSAVAWAIFTDEDDDMPDEEPEAAASAPVRPLPCCGYCGRDERDGVGPIVFGACADCTRTWSS